MGFVFAPGIKRRPAAAAASLIILTAGVFFAVRAATSNDTLVQKWEDSNSKMVAKMTSSGSLTLSGTFISERTTDLGWAVVAGANAACNATCTTACVFGVNTAATEADIVGCTDTTADECLCAGAT